MWGEADLAGWAGDPPYMRGKTDLGPGSLFWRINGLLLDKSGDYPQV
jgi:hypothetical protein